MANHRGFWVLGPRFESGRGYPTLYAYSGAEFKSNIKLFKYKQHFFFMYKKILLTTIFILIFLVILNFYVKITYSNESMTSYFGRDNIVFHEQTLDYSTTNPFQKVEGELPYELKKSFTGLAQGKEVRTNSIGLKDREYPLSKLNNTVRIIVLGDSITFGAREEQENSYSELLENKLNKQSEYKFEVWNAGVS